LIGNKFRSLIKQFFSRLQVDSFTSEGDPLILALFRLRPQIFEFDL
jgi:hypothetical protein